MAESKKKALFICLGNICRSPIAEGVFQKTVNDMNIGDQWEIDSAAIGGWHVGNPPDWRALDTMKKHNVPYNNHARQITAEDFNYYDYIFGMDEANMRDLNRFIADDTPRVPSIFSVCGGRHASRVIYKMFITRSNYVIGRFIQNKRCIILHVVHAHSLRF